MHAILSVVFTSILVRVAPIELLFPTADAAQSSSMLTLGDTAIPGIFVALALRIALPRCSKNRFFNCAFLRYTVGLTVAIIIMNWFQVAQGVQPALLYVAPGVIGFVAVHCLWNGEVKQDGTNQLMGKVWDWNNMYGTKLKKFDGWVLHTGNEGGNGSEDDDHEGGPEDGYGGEEDAAAPLEDRGYGDEEDAAAPLEDHDGDQDDHGAASEDSNDGIKLYGQRALQVLAIRANFPISIINGYDWQLGRTIYVRHEGGVQEKGMVDLIPIGPSKILMAYGYFCLEVFHSATSSDTTTNGDEGSSRVGSPITVERAVCGDDDDDDEEPEEYTQTIYGGPCRILEITYLVIPYAIEANVEVRLNLKDLGSRSHVVYGKIKASNTDYGNRSIHLFSRERGRSCSVPVGSSSMLPLSRPMIALSCDRKLELQLEVDLTVISISDNQEDEEKNLKFTGLKFTPRVSSQEREVDEDQVEVNITWNEIPI